MFEEPVGNKMVHVKGFILQKKKKDIKKYSTRQSRMQNKNKHVCKQLSVNCFPPLL